MEVRFTPGQQRVIDLRDCNILVSAAAGSGKTAVLVERIIRRVLDETHPVDIDRILVLTYTKAAAGEMKERIRQAIMRELTKNPESVHLQRQATLIHNAQITTMHSFNLFIVRNHFNEIGLDPAFRIAKDGELKLLSGEVMEELLEREFEKRDENFRSFLEYFPGDGSTEEISNVILQLAELASSYPWPLDWLEERKADYREDTLSGPAKVYLDNYIRAVLGEMLHSYDKMIALVEQPDGPYMYGEMADAEREYMERILAREDWEEKRNLICGLSFKNLPSKRDDAVDPKKREQAKNIRDGIKKSFIALKSDFFEGTPLLEKQQTRAMEKPMEKLLDMTRDYLVGMKEKKAEKKIIDFGDMEHFALDILVKRENGELKASQVAKEYRAYFEEIMTDEYQDSNLVQETILNVLSGMEDGKYNRFMVGDVKQSIYKFRLARPELFLEKLSEYQEDGPCTKVMLSQNFRSRSQVLDGVNNVFSRIMSKEKGGIEYDEDASLHPGASYPEYEPAGNEYMLVEAPAKEDGISTREAEIIAIGNKIQWLLENYRVTDKRTGLLRPVVYSDIVILMRSTAGVEDSYKRILGEKGIPVYTESKKGYFETTEIRILLNVLKVLDNPSQEIPLYGVLTSVFGGFSEEEIAELCCDRHKDNLYDVLLDNRDKPKIDGFLGWLEEYRKKVLYLPIRELLENLTEDVDYLAYVSALPLGAKRKANVEMLFTKASEFADTKDYGLFHFVRYIERLKSYDEDYGEADLLDESAQVVRLMSIHKSKGLEFPITILAGLDKGFCQKGMQQNLVTDMDLGLGIRYQNNQTRVRNATMRHRVIVKKLAEDAVAEELRVLYVAMTRAKEKLIMSAVCKKPEKTMETIEMGEDELSYGAFLTAKSYNDFLFPILGKCGIPVSVVNVQAGIKQEAEHIKNRMDRQQLLWETDRQPDVQQLSTKLRENFESKYPHASLEGLVAKTTVSELKIAAMAGKDEEAYHTFEEKEVVPYIPSFIQKTEEVTGTQRGNAYHRVMELLDFGWILQENMSFSWNDYTDFRNKVQEILLFESVKKHLDNLSKSGLLQQEYRKIVDDNKITHFILSELGYRMWMAQRNGTLHREQPFVLGIAASELDSKLPSEEKVLIQGIIDAYFVEDDKIILLDYKTDTITSMGDLWNRYETQLDYYTRALEQLTCKKVSEKYLYSFCLEKY